MEISVEELKELQYESKIAVINEILEVSEKYVYYCNKTKQNLLDGEKFRKEIKEIGEKLGANYFPLNVPE